MEDELAFPQPIFMEKTDSMYTTIQSTPGLTKRELFAAMAMQGILANSELLRNHKDADHEKIAVKGADALIAELSKTKETHYCNHCWVRMLNALEGK